MGNYRFRLSDMIPNAWFYKLKDMSNTKTTTTNHRNKQPPSTSPENNHLFRPKNSIYYTPKVSQFRNSPNFPHLQDNKYSSKRPTPPNNRKTIYNDYKPSPKHTTESTHSPSSESTQSGLTSASDIVIEVNEKKKMEYEFSSELMELQLPPIITKPPPGKRHTSSRSRQTLSVVSDNKKLGEESNQLPVPAPKSGVSSGVKVSKRSVQIRSSAARRENLSETSLAIVKSSFDPEKDFMQSMMEMITENNIRSSKDLEELLACYLSLNSDEYHDVIVRAFEQIWFTLPNL